MIEEVEKFLNKIVCEKCVYINGTFLEEERPSKHFVALTFSFRAEPP